MLRGPPLEGKTVVIDQGGETGGEVKKVIIQQAPEAGSGAGGGKVEIKEEQ